MAIRGSQSVYDSSDPDPGLRPGDLFAHYEIVALAGRGGMGVVYKAVHVRMQQPRALKLLRADLTSAPGYEDRFSREAKLAASIDRHENVVIIYDSGIEDGRFFLAMEWIDGEDLRSILDRDGALDPATAVAVVLQTAHALEAVHAKLVHRDIKPGNIMVRRAGETLRAYLTDFGIARPAAGGDTVTEPGAALGTLGYASPEQWMGRVDRRSDLYALGCVFYEAISGKPVFSADNEEALGRAHAENTLPSLGPVLGSPYEPFDRFLAKALAIDPDSRYGSATEFARALKAAATECGVTPVRGADAPRDSGPERLPVAPVAFKERRHAGGALGVAGAASSTKRAGKRIALTLLASVAVVGAGVGVWALLQHPKPRNVNQLSSPWHERVFLGSAPLGSPPTAGADASGSVYVFWAGTNDVLWEKYFVGNGWNTGPISAAGDHVASQPAVAVHLGGEQDVFWKGTDKTLRELVHNGSWGKLQRLKSGPMGSPPAAGADANGSVYVFWKGNRNGSLWVDWYLDGRWHGPNRIVKAGHGLANQPAVAVQTDGDQHVFYQGSDGTLWEISHTLGGWQQPQHLEQSGQMGSAPTAGVDEHGIVDVFWRGTNGSLMEMWDTGGIWNGPTQVTPARHGLATLPAVAVQPGGKQDVFWEGLNQALYQTYYPK